MSAFVAEHLSIDEAQRAVLDRVRPLPAERVALGRAAGRVLAAAARAVVDLPPFPSSAMDGFALRSADTPGSLPVVAEVAAGRPSDRPLEPGEAMRISTGGVVPEGADAVVPLEQAGELDGRISVAEGVKAGAHVRPRGGDVAAGDVVVPPGTRLGPAQIGALAAAGLGEVECARRPRVAVLTTGSELRSAGEELSYGEIYESNRPLLAAALRRAGAEVELLPSARDDETAHRAGIERGLEADVLVTSGGVSVGQHDLVRGVGAELGVEEVFWRVAVKPGKPVWFGVRDSTLVFGLPGNPVSTLVGAELFVAPALRALQGAEAPLPVLRPGRLTTALRRSSARDELVRARSRVGADAVEVEPVPGQDSHMIARAAAADVLVLVPRGEGELPAGSQVRYLEIS